MVQSMFNHDKQLAWSAYAFIIIFKVDDKIPDKIQASVLHV